MPQAVDGILMDPPVSVPRAAGTKPAATATPDPLESDEDRTQVDPECIARGAVARLLRGALDRDPLNERKIGLYENESKRLMEASVPVLPAGSVWVVAG